MKHTSQTPTRRVLIASSHPLFGQGLRSLLHERRQTGVEVIGMVSNLEEALQAIEQLTPDLVIVDYDDQALNRDEFLARFVEGEKKLRVVLLSLQSSSQAIIYDRRTLAAAKIDDWLEEWRSNSEIPITSAENGALPPKTPSRSSNMKHLVIAGFLVVLVTALLILGLGQAHLLPIQASAQARPIDQLFRLEFMVIAFLFSLIVVFMIYSIFVFRRKPGDTSDARHVEGNTRLEVAWTVAPLALVMVFAYLGGDSLSETLRADPRPLEINVIGQQWTWRFEYPDYNLTSSTLYMPVDKQAILHLSSADVIHSFWVPEFRVKQDALPGGDDFIRDLRITPTLIGDYKVRCAELCGLQHALMESPVKVVSQADFDVWLAEQSDFNADPVARGEKAVKDYGCLACHSLDGSKGIGPTWKSLLGRQEKLTDGSTVTVDESYLRYSILNPNSQIVEGFPAGVMPQNFAQQLSQATLADIIAYLSTLK
ncbi:MAG: cytochrome c oxidase subunit II [Chloroflexota bacterium]